jgi:carboxynorspermidine decarboxylase
MTTASKNLSESGESRFAGVDTPSFVLDEAVVTDSASRLRTLAEQSGATLFYSVKACPLPRVLELVAPHVHGYSVSSLFEAQLSKRLSQSHMIQLVSPALRIGEIKALLSICDRITLNSLGQLESMTEVTQRPQQLGIRLNPGTGFVIDPRYDPCRRNSKLGVPAQKLRAWLADSEATGSISGLHFHSNCDSSDLRELTSTLQRLETVLGENLRQFAWLNVGGGYTYEDDSNVSFLCGELLRIRRDHGLDVVMEPGAAFVRRAGYFISSVVDIQSGEDYPIAILDLTVNHWPEVFEYQFEPDVEGHVDEGKFRYLFAGCSCLAGDVFGVYSFKRALRVGSRIVFRDAGAYSIVKAHMFNGINLPNIYTLTEENELVLRKSFTYEDFASRFGVEPSAVV